MWCAIAVEWDVKIQVLYLTFERLWHVVRETFAPVWSLSKLFMLRNLVIKSSQKIRLENIQNRRPRGSLIKYGGFWDFWMCRASADDQSPRHSFWSSMNLGLTLSDQCRKPDSRVINQSISAQCARMIRRANIETFYPMHGCPQPFVFREHFTQINCSQSVKVKIRCCKEICQIYATRDICWCRFGF